MKLFSKSAALILSAFGLCGQVYALDYNWTKPAGYDITAPNAPVPYAAAINQRDEIQDQLARMSPMLNFRVAVWAERNDAFPEGLVFSGAAPLAFEGYRFLAKLGIKTVISLEALNYDDQEFCAANGLECLNYDFFVSPATSFANSASFQGAFRRLVKDTKAGRKVYVHCLLGHHRTGALVMAQTIRNAACGRKFDKAALHGEAAGTLAEHYGYTGLASVVFIQWRNEVLGWVDDFENNQWLCR